MARLYNIGAKLEREHCHNAISGGALVAMRGAGSKCYSKENKYKIDTIFIYKDKIVLAQHKKRGIIKKKDLAGLIELQNLIPIIEVCVGSSDKLMNVKELAGELFGKRVRAHP